jgi:hypothetical protein
MKKVWPIIVAYAFAVVGGYCARKGWYEFAAINAVTTAIWIRIWFTRVEED